MFIYILCMAVSWLFYSYYFLLEMANFRFKILLSVADWVFDILKSVC